MSDISDLQRLSWAHKLVCWTIFSALIVITNNFIWETGAASHSKNSGKECRPCSQLMSFLHRRRHWNQETKTDDHQFLPYVSERIEKQKKKNKWTNYPHPLICLFVILHRPSTFIRCFRSSLITQFDTATAFLKSKERSQRVDTISWKGWKGFCQRPEARRGWTTQLGCFGQSESMDLVNLALQTSSYIYIQSLFSECW